MVSRAFLSIYFVLILLLLGLSHQRYGVEGSRVLSQEDHDFDLELERQLKILNKPSIKTIQTNGGDTFDCVDIHKQPAWIIRCLRITRFRFFFCDLKMRPSSRPKMMKVSSVSKLSNSGLKPLGCPTGTVPIRRTGKDDLIRAKPFFDSYRSSILSEINPGEHYAIRRTTDKGPYYGLSGLIGLDNPKVENDQFSSAQLWVGGGQFIATTLQAGWAVAPQLFGDAKTRIFVYSNSDLNPQGCYNLLCQGFVQVQADIAIGAAFENISIYDGKQFAASYMIYHDNETAGWWLAVGGSVTVDIGYWPSNIYTQLQNSASRVAWGGFVKGTPNGPSPPMGNGQYPKHSFKQACSIVELQMVNWNNTLVNPDDLGSKHETHADSPNCYKGQYEGYIKGNGDSFLFGGPGDKNCGP